MNDFNQLLYFLAISDVLQTLALHQKFPFLDYLQLLQYFIQYLQIFTIFKDTRYTFFQIYLSKILHLLHPF